MFDYENYGDDDWNYDGDGDWDETRTWTEMPIGINL